MQGGINPGNPISPLGFTDFENIANTLGRSIEVTLVDGLKRIFGGGLGGEPIFLEEAVGGPNSNGVTHYQAPGGIDVPQTPGEPNSCAVDAIAAQVDGKSPFDINKIATDFPDISDITIDWNSESPIDDFIEKLQKHNMQDGVGGTKDVNVQFIQKHYQDPKKGGNVHKANGQSWKSNDIRTSVSTKVPTKSTEQVDHRFECQTIANAMEELNIQENTEEAFAIKKILNHPRNLEALDTLANI